jgi:hypothetical protein
MAHAGIRPVLHAALLLERCSRARRGVLVWKFADEANRWLVLAAELVSTLEGKEPIGEEGPSRHTLYHFRSFQWIHVVHWTRSVFGYSFTSSAQTSIQNVKHTLTLLASSFIDWAFMQTPGSMAFEKAPGKDASKHSHIVMVLSHESRVPLLRR